MTMPNERTEALLRAGSLLIRIAQDSSLPLALRQRAITIARHFPTIEDLSCMAMSSSQSVYDVQIAPPLAVLSDVDSADLIPLRHSTKFSWPDN